MLAARIAKTLLWITCPGCSVLIAAPVFLGPPPDWVYLFFAVAQLAAVPAFYKLIKRAGKQEAMRYMARYSLPNEND